VLALVVSIDERPSTSIALPETGAHQQNQLVALLKSTQPFAGAQ